MGILDAPAYSPRAYRPVSIPAGLGWDSGTWPLTATLADIPGGLRTHAVVDVTAESLFNSVSIALSNPANTYYVNVSTGNDSTGTGASGAPWKSISKAVAAANASAQPAKIIVAAGTYWRTNNIWYNAGSGVTPSVDVAFVASGGRVVTGSFDPPGTPTLDVTYGNCYSWTLANCEQVLDMVNLDRFGMYTPLRKVASAALCNSTPGSWALSGGTIYVNRADDKAVTNTTTRVFRPSTGAFVHDQQASVYFGGVSAGDGWDFEGGNNIAAFDVHQSSAMNTNEVIAVRDSTFRYAHGSSNTAARAVSIESWRGLAAFFNCDASAAGTDGWNFHNTYTQTGMHVLTVNCTAANNGRPSNVSCNSWTTHENVKAIDLAGHYRYSHGGNIRSIDSSLSLLAGTFADGDVGDVCHGGTVPPTAFRVDGTATYWCDRVRVSQPAGSLAFVATSGASIHKRNAWPSALSDSGAGTIDTY